MNDPHVEALYYNVEHDVHIDYSSTGTFKKDLPDFSIIIEDRRVTVILKKHFGSTDEAQTFVKPYLDLWELHLALQYGPRSLEFKYERSDLIDRSPTPGNYVIVADTGNFGVTFHPVNFILSLQDFPPPPTDIALNPTVELMYARYLLYRNGRTTLADAAYYCLTALELEVGRRAQAAEHFAISGRVLGKMGELAEKKGGKEARKAKGRENDFAPVERQWLEQAMVIFIRRAAEIAYDPKAMHEQISMASLPSLPTT